MILIVDDKAENLFSLKTLLQLNAYDVDTAASGEEALRKVLKTEYALIILDVQMPDMDGYEVAEAITGYSKSKDIPIIFLSAVNIDKRFVTRGYASGGVDYITKPFDPDMLMLKVKTFYRLFEQTRELKRIGDVLKEEIEERKKAQKALEQVNFLLEDKVAERTRELLHMNRELEVSNIELQQFASVASHDLQEPLRKIVTFSRMIQDRFLHQVPEAGQLIQKVISSTERMRNLIDDLLQYSKLSSASNFIQTNLKSVVEDTITDLEHLIKEKNAVVFVEDMPAAEVMPGQMRQVFQNIISNALKFSKAEVRPLIRIWGEQVEKKLPDSKKKTSGPFLRICISDNGIGFNELYLGKIFTIFQRLHGRTEYEGTGIGLAIVKKIIEKHNGLITAKSREGEGATFVIVLPMQQTEPRLEPAVVTQQA